MPIDSFQAEGVEDILHGITVADPYRWLERRDQPATERWVAAQRQALVQYFADRGQTNSLRNRLTSLIDIDLLDQPTKVGERYFYLKRKRGAEQFGIFVRDAARGYEHSLIEPPKDNLYTSVRIHHIAPSGSFLAYEVRHGGEHTKAINIVDVSSGQVLTDGLERGLARGFAFTVEENGFFYCHEEQLPCKQTKPFHCIKVHYFGQPATADKEIFRVRSSQHSKLILLSDDSTLGALSVYERNTDILFDFFIAGRGTPDNWRHVCSDAVSNLRPILHSGRILAVSHKGAQNGKIVRLTEDGKEAQVVVPESGAPITQVAIAADSLLVLYIADMTPAIKTWSLDGGQLGDIEVINDSTVVLLPAYDPRGESIFLEVQSFSQPPTILQYTPSTQGVTEWFARSDSPEIPVPKVRHSVYISKDGTRIPISILGLQEPDASTPRPVIMTAYGGFGKSMTPQFTVLVTVLLELGFVFALPNIRGGGEFGKEWHQAAIGSKRQVAIDDFIAAADWLCSERITCPEQFALFGGSNSGLLVAAAVVQRPELFRAALCIAPLLDMLRYHLFDRAYVWRDEYGTADDPEECFALHSYSPYHNVQEDVNYPALLFVTGDNDQRCNPAHVRKMAARLQGRAAQTNVILVDYSLERGHAPTMPVSVRIEALMRRIIFLCHELRVNLPTGVSR